MLNHRFQGRLPRTLALGLVVGACSDDDAASSAYDGRTRFPTLTAARSLAHGVRSRAPCSRLQASPQR